MDRTIITSAARLISRLFNMSEDTARAEAERAFNEFPGELVTDAPEMTFKERLAAEREAEGWRPVV